MAFAGGNGPGAGAGGVGAYRGRRSEAPLGCPLSTVTHALTQARRPARLPPPPGPSPPFRPTPGNRGLLPAPSARRSSGLPATHSSRVVAARGRDCLLVIPAASTTELIGPVRLIYSSRGGGDLPSLDGEIRRRPGGVFPSTRNLPPVSHRPSRHRL